MFRREGTGNDVLIRLESILNFHIDFIWKCLNGIFQMHNFWNTSTKNWLKLTFPNFRFLQFWSTKEWSKKFKYHAIHIWIRKLFLLILSWICNLEKWPKSAMTHMYAAMCERGWESERWYMKVVINWSVILVFRTHPSAITSSRNPITATCSSIFVFDSGNSSRDTR